ncbi:hypothetical protein MRX96_001401 [Rhipicephalus microplus]
MLPSYQHTNVLSTDLPDGRRRHRLERVKTRFRHDGSLGRLPDIPDGLACRNYRHPCYLHRHLPPLPLYTLPHVRWPATPHLPGRGYVAEGSEKLASSRCTELQA